jgi:hypothetical protein
MSPIIPDEVADPQSLSQLSGVPVLFPHARQFTLIAFLNWLEAVPPATWVGTAQQDKDHPLAVFLSDITGQEDWRVTSSALILTVDGEERSWPIPTWARPFTQRIAHLPMSKLTAGRCLDLLEGEARR